MVGKINKIQARNLINEFNTDFKPPLLCSERNIEIESYCKKISNNAEFVIEKEGDKYIGFSAIYANNKDGIAYLIFLAIHKEYRKLGYGYKILKKIEKIAIDNGMKSIKLEVRNENNYSINFYKKNGYEYLSDASKTSIYMIKLL